MMASDSLTLIAPNGKPVFLAFTDKALSIKRSNGNAKSDTQQVTLRQVIGVSLSHSCLSVSFVVRKKRKDPFALVKVEGTVKDDDIMSAEEWVEALMEAAYDGVKRNKSLKVLINPHSGQGKAVSIFSKKVQPIFTTAGCTLDITHTTHSNHAYEIAKDLELGYDAVVALSGDGTIHEVMNGFAHHKHPVKAFSTPIVPIPTGSGNGLSLNLLGSEEGFDVIAAALNVIKGRPMSIDLFSITQGDRRTFSFMSQALGLMADLDIGTENLRWMGAARFMVGLLRGIMQFKPCPVKLSIKLAEDDKLKMVEDLQRRHQQRIATKAKDVDSTPSVSAGTDANSDVESLPTLKYTADEEDGWITFDKPLLYVYAGKGPYVGRDFMPFPVSLPDDGLVDIVAQELSTRAEMIKAMDGAEKGQAYWIPTARYFKAHAYRVKPLSPRGYFAVDGEAFPFEEFQVEVHRGLATLLSPYGYYAAEFSAMKPPVKTTRG